MLDAFLGDVLFEILYDRLQGSHLLRRVAFTRGTDLASVLDKLRLEFVILLLHAGMTATTGVTSDALSRLWTTGTDGVLKTYLANSKGSFVSAYKQCKHMRILACTHAHIQQFRLNTTVETHFTVTSLVRSLRHCGHPCSV